MCSRRSAEVAIAAERFDTLERVVQAEDAPSPNC